MSRLRGRFRGPTDADMDRFSSSIEIDLQMAQEDIAGSIAHAVMLGEVGIVTAEESRRLTRGLEQIGQELESGDFAPPSSMKTSIWPWNSDCRKCWAIWQASCTRRARATTRWRPMFGCG